MRPTLKATIALGLSLLVLLVAAAAGARTGGPSSPIVTGPRAMPESDGTGQAVPGWDGTGQAPAPVAPPFDAVEPIPCGQTVVSGDGPDGSVAFAPCPGEPIPEPSP